MRPQGEKMREFHILALNTNLVGHEVVCDYEVGEFDTGVFAQCRCFDGAWPSDVRLLVEKGKSTDYLGGPISWPIVSDRLARILRAFAPTDIQFVQAPLFWADSGTPVAGFAIANILRSIETLDLNQCVTSEMDILGRKITNVIKCVFRASMIPAEVHCFRPKESKYHIVVSDELAHAMTGMVGMAFIRTRTVP